MPAKKKQEECAEMEAWVTSFADLMSLLCVFFILMFAMANTDARNFAQIAEALRLAFNGVGSSPSPVTVSGESQGAGETTSSAAAPVTFDRLPPRQQDFIRASTELTVFAEQLGVGGQINVSTSYEGIIISLSDELVFEPGSATLKPESTAVLDTVVEILLSNANEVRIDGHTDDIPTNTPLFPSNWDLSVARAVAIVRYLTEVGGVPPERLTAAGKGEFEPLVPNDSRANRARNRRADIVMIYENGERQFSVDLPDLQLEVTN